MSPLQITCRETVIVTKAIVVEVSFSVPKKLVEEVRAYGRQSGWKTEPIIKSIEQLSPTSEAFWPPRLYAPDTKGMKKREPLPSRISRIQAVMESGPSEVIEETFSQVLWEGVKACAAFAEVSEHMHMLLCLLHSSELQLSWQRREQKIDARAKTMRSNATPFGRFEKSLKNHPDAEQGEILSDDTVVPARQWVQLRKELLSA